MANLFSRFGRLMRRRRRWNPTLIVTPSGLHNALMRISLVRLITRPATLLMISSSSRGRSASWHCPVTFQCCWAFAISSCSGTLTTHSPCIRRERAKFGNCLTLMIELRHKLGTVMERSPTWMQSARFLVFPIRISSSIQNGDHLLSNSAL